MSKAEYVSKDYYAVLGVPEDASAKDISRAYRKLAQRYHPDANPDAQAEDRFKEISAAHAVLSDKEKRVEYDQVRRYAREAGPFVGGGQAGEGHRFSVNDIGDLGDLLRGFGFQTQGGRGGRRVRADTGFSFQVPGQDLETDLRLSFEDALAGVTTSLPIYEPSGEIRKVTVKVPAGVRDGARIRLRGKGGRSQDGAPPGDLYLNVHVAKHPVFGRRGNDLTLALPVTFAEAALGAEVRVPTLGEPVTVRVPAGTASGQVLKVRGHGAPSGPGRGDLLVTVEVAVPKKLTKEQRQTVERLAALQKDSPRAHLDAALGDGGRPHAEAHAASEAGA